MDEKYNRLIQILKEAGGSATAGTLAARMDVSARSIKNYIAEINRRESGSIVSGHDGYRVGEGLTEELFGELDGMIPQTPNDRVKYIIRKLLADGTNYDHAINLYDLADEMCISYETVRKDLVKVKRQLQGFDLSVHISNHEMTLEGRETDIRKMLSTLVYFEFNDNVVTIEVIQKTFPQYDVLFLRDMIEEKCRAYHYYINGYSLLNLVLDVLIGMERVRNNNIAIGSTDNIRGASAGNGGFGGREMELTAEITTAIEQKFDIIYPEVEIHTLALMLVSYLMHIDYEKIQIERLDDVVGEDCMKLVKRLLEDMDTYYFYDIENTDFVIRFALHIKNLMLRLQCGYTTKNALTDHIKTTCPLVFDCAVILADRIREETGCKVDEDEIAYIALHIGAIMDTQQSLRHSATCTLLFPQYYNMANKLVNKITEHFQKSLIITEIVETEQQLVKAKPADFILSTVPLPGYDQDTCLQITPFLAERDCIAVKECIRKVVKSKKVKRLKDHMQYMANEAFFCRNQGFGDKEEAIRFMTDCMKQEGYVGEGFMEEVMDRERNSSTAFSHIAVPHSMKMQAQRTGMFVLLNDKPLDWGSSKVNIVLMFAIHKEDKGMFHDVFDNLIVLLLEKENAMEVQRAEHYNAFIDAIISCYENAGE